MNGAVPWYQSRSVMGAIAAIIMTIATQFHLLPASVTQDQVLSFLLMAVPMAVALEGRINATKVVTTPAKAAAINAAAAPDPLSFAEARREALDLFHFPHLPAPEAPADPATASPVSSMENDMSTSTTLAALSTEALTILKNAGQEVETFALSESQKFVAEAKQSDLGTLALNLIQTLDSHTMSGTAKMGAVIGALVPAIKEFIANGGLKGLLTSILSFAIEFCQSCYNDFRADLAAVSARANTALAA